MKVPEQNHRRLMITLDLPFGCLTLNLVVPILRSKNLRHRELVGENYSSPVEAMTKNGDDRYTLVVKGSRFQAYSLRLLPSTPTDPILACLPIVITELLCMH